MELETLYQELKRFIELKAFIYSNGDQFVNEELCQIGYIAIHNAIQTYKPDSKATLKSYAMRTIMWEMKDYLTDNLRQIRIPANLTHDKEFRYKQPISGSIVVNEDEGTTILDNVPESPLNGLNNDYIWSRLSYLTEDEQKIVRMRFLEEKFLEEIGDEFGVTKEAIRLRLNRILKKLKNLIDLDEVYE